MTEEEWRSGVEHGPMLRQVLRQVGPSRRRDRQLRRFACACARRVRDELGDEGAERALALIERAVDQPSMRRDLERAARVMDHVIRETLLGSLRGWPAGVVSARGVVSAACQPDACEAAWGASDSLTGVYRGTGRWQCELLRELFGNPFRPVALPEGWRGFQRGLIVRLARQAYAERSFDSLPVLADALEDAGCADAELLGHCRQGEGHQPGCWAVELLRDED